MSHRRFLPIVASLAALPCLAADDADPAVSFRDDVAPILVSRCLGCHNAEDAQGGLNMATFATLKKGGDIEGDLILLPGEPNESHLIRVLRSDAAIRMPYKQEPLSDEQVSILERWIAQGATFDGPSETETALSSLVDPLTLLPEVAVTAAVADPVAAVSYAPDGKTLAAARGNDVLLIDPSQGETVATLADHPGPVHAVRFAPDGSTLIAAGGRAGLFGSVVVWDLETKQRRHDLRGHDDAILSAALSPDGKTLATSSYDRLVKLWDVDGGAERRTLKEHTDAVYAVAFSPDGQTVASASGDRTVKLWDVDSGRRLVSLGDATAELYAVTFSRDGKAVMAGGVDRSIWRWTVDGNNGTLDRSTIAHDAAILRLLVSPDGQTLYSTGEDQTVKSWSLPDLKPQGALPRQPDWPLAAALNPDGSGMALGRYDGSLAVLPTSAGSDRAAVTLLEAPRGKADVPSSASSADTPEKAPALVRRPTLGPPGPKGAERGSTRTVHLSGNGVGQANSVVFDEPTLQARIVPSESPEPNKLRVEVTIAPDARIGRHSFWVQTPLGVPAPQGFAVYEAPESNEAEPNDRPEQATEAPMPRTLAGAINAPGDVDFLRIDARAGQELVLIDRGGALGSALDPALELRDAEGRVVARGRSTIAYRSETDGPLTLRVADRQFGGSGNHYYRIEVGEAPRLDNAFPLGVSRAEPAEVAVSGWNLDGDGTVEARAPAVADPGSTLPVPAVGPDGRIAEGGPKLVVADGPRAVEIEPNDEPSRGLAIASPGSVSGRIETEGDRDHFTIEARKGRPLVVEVFGHRIDTEIDPFLEILDAEGHPLPRAVLRPVAELAVAFRDHNASQNRIRLTKWDELAMDDYLLIGRELTRLFALPRNPDDDAVFWSMGGQRLAYLGTTPEQHPQDQPITKVEIHPPGTTFPPGGASPVTLFHQNDDAPGRGKDAAILFDPPADGTYVLHVSDARGLGGDAFGYHLVVREPRPDFDLSISTDHPDIPRGGAVVVTVDVRRIDGFDGPIDVRVEDLPPGISATSARVEPGHFSADLHLSADETAPTFSPPTWRVVAEAPVDGSSGEILRHELDPGGPRSGWITVTPEPDLKVRSDRSRVALRPGQRVELTFRVERSPAFTGRVPIDVRNLPHGVRVLNIGLNGVLITERQTERTVFLYAEPWVQPTTRPFYAVGRIESAGIDHSSPPITLVVE